jgi:hypothetical protein
MKFQIPLGISGSALKELLFKYVNYLSTLNEERNRIAYQRDRQKVVVDVIKDLALQLVGQDSAFRSLPVSLKSAHASMYKVKHPITGDMTTLFEERMKLTKLDYALSRANAKVRELETMINVCRSALSFDKAEMNQISTAG